MKDSMIRSATPGIKDLSARLKNWCVSRSRAIGLVLILLTPSQDLFSQDSLPPLSLLKKLSLEELLNLEVTSISMRPEKLIEAPSAIQVITGEDIYRSCATRLPEALRLASNLQIAQTNSHDWAVTARGFNGLPSAGGILANKLLVMIDGRSVYNPLFGGVYWDVQNTLLHDLDRIEVVSGPGGTLWGANAVNGVINVVSKSAKETQGVYASGATGSLINDVSGIRIGGRSKRDPDLYFRVYGQHYDQKSVWSTFRRDAKDNWNMGQAGFRMDYYPSRKNTFTLQGDAYRGEANPDTVTRFAITSGQNVLARFVRSFSDSSDLKIQVYYDRTWRTTPTSTQKFFYSLYTYDLDIQHRFPIKRRQSLLYGGGIRFQQDRTARTFLPLSRDMPLFTLFVQDEITLLPEKLRLTLGSKFLHNVYTGFEYQPCARLGFSWNRDNTLWSSVSRAVRTPSRLDVDIILTDVKFRSEKVIAYELGYKAKVVDRTTLSFATFFNDYFDVRSLDSSYDPKPRIIFANSQRAQSWGFEFNGTCQVTDKWRIRGGYTYFERSLWTVNRAALPVSADLESLDPKQVVMVQSIANLGRYYTFDLVGRYVDQLPAGVIVKSVPAYVTFDVRLAFNWKLFEFSLAGQNLLEYEHTEVGNTNLPRTVYARVRCQF